MLYKFGSNLNLKMNGNYVITVNSVHRLSYIAGDPSACFQSRVWPSGHRVGEGNGVVMASLSFLAILYNLSRRCLCHFLLLCFPVALLISGELPPSNQRLCRHSVALNSSACSLHTQPTRFCCLISPGNCSARSSSSWPATFPSQALRRGQSSTVRLCPAESCFSFATMPWYSMTH